MAAALVSTATSDFAECFWGDKHAGYGVLVSNVKSGQSAIKELLDVVKDRVQLEDDYLKQSNKHLAKISNMCQQPAQHNFNQFWQLTKNCQERLGQQQTQLIANFQSLSKEVHRYGEELREAARALKEPETLDAVGHMQAGGAGVAKARDAYMARCHELERHQAESATAKEIVKAEQRRTKARDDYAAALQRYASARETYERRLRAVAQKMETHERAHLVALKSFLVQYAGHLSRCHERSAGDVAEFRRHVLEVDVNDLLEQFVLEKGTGKDRPPALQMDEYEPAAGAAETSAAKSANESPAERRQQQQNANAAGLDGIFDAAESDTGNRSVSASTSSAVSNNNSATAPGLDKPQFSLALGQRGSEVPVDPAANLIHLSPVEEIGRLAGRTGEPPLAQPETEQLDVSSGEYNERAVDVEHIAQGSPSTAGHNAANKSPSKAPDVASKGDLNVQLVTATTGSLESTVVVDAAVPSASATASAASSTEATLQVPAGGPVQATASSSSLSSKLSNLMSHGRGRSKSSLKEAGEQQQQKGDAAPSEDGVSPLSMDVDNETEKKVEPHAQSSTFGNFFKKRSKEKRSKAKHQQASTASLATAEQQQQQANTLGVDDNQSEASSRSDVLQANADGDEIRELPVDRHAPPKWERSRGSADDAHSSDFSDSDDEQTKKIRQIKIAPVLKPQQSVAEGQIRSAGDDELVAAVGKMSLSRNRGASVTEALDEAAAAGASPGKQRSMTTVVPPPTALLQPADRVQLLRPALTGDGRYAPSSYRGAAARRAHHQTTSTSALPASSPFANAPFTPAQLPSAGGQQPTATGGVQQQQQMPPPQWPSARARPRSSTPTAEMARIAAFDAATAGSAQLRLFGAVAERPAAAEQSRSDAGPGVDARRAEQPTTSKSAEHEAPATREAPSPSAETETDQFTPLASSGHAATMGASVKAKREHYKSTDSLSSWNFSQGQDVSSQSNTLRGALSVSSLSSSSGISTAIPIAMQMTETVHAQLCTAEPSRSKTRVFGSLYVSFPASAIDRLVAAAADSVSAPAHNDTAAGAVPSAFENLACDSEPAGTAPPLRFALGNAARLNAIIPNKQVLSSEAQSQFISSDEHTFQFDPVSLAAHLKAARAAKPLQKFYNIEVLRYEVRAPVPPPLKASSYWKCAPGQTDIRLDYQLNDECCLSAPLLNVDFKSLVDGAVADVTTKPEAQWQPPDRLSWRLTELSHADAQSSSGSLKARLRPTKGPSTTQNTYIGFSTVASDASLSSASVSVDAPGYRLSLLRRKVVAGKYFVEPVKM